MGTIKVNDGSAPAEVIKVVGEPAIVINGVPNVNPDYGTSVRASTENNTESEFDPFLGEWLEGRRVRKLFRDRYYSGKVVEYDDEMNWYRVVYEDGDLEDLEWRELEEVLVPLDISIPLKTLALQRCKHEQSPSNTSTSKPRKSHDSKSRGGKGKTPKLLQQAETNDVVSNQLLVLKKEPNSKEALKGQNENTKGGKDVFHTTDDSSSTKRQREIQRQSSRTAHAEKQKRRERSNIKNTLTGAELS